MNEQKQEEKRRHNYAHRKTYNIYKMLWKNEVQVQIELDQWTSHKEKVAESQISDKKEKPTATPPSFGHPKSSSTKQKK